MKITNNQLSLEEHTRQNFVVQPAQGFTREDANDPESWVHVVQRIEPLAKLSVLSADRTWYGEYIVLKTGNEFAIAETLYRDLVPAIGDEISGNDSDYQVSWGGPAQRYRVKRKSDGAIIVSGMEKDAAEAWVANAANSARAA